MAVTTVVLSCIQNKQTCFCDSESVLKMFELVHTYMGSMYVFCFLTRNGSTKTTVAQGVACGLTLKLCYF